MYKLTDMYIHLYYGIIVVFVDLKREANWFCQDLELSVYNNYIYHNWEEKTCVHAYCYHNYIVRVYQASTKRRFCQDDLDILSHVGMSVHAHYIGIRGVSARG